ncbi:MAG: M43 family zinc metalloprotease [Flavobacteriales bacterium]
MKNLIAFALLLLLAVLQGISQTCPSDELNDSLLQHDIEFSRSFHYMEHVLGANQNLPASERTDEIYTIPVVVHVIHTGEAYGTGTNITDEQIFSAIEALNEDFRRVPGTNGYGNGVDVRIEFCLAARSPSNQATTGIVRVNGSSVANYATMGIESTSGNGASETAVKALSTWPRASYMNIWVVNEIGNNDGGAGTQGYAYFPTNSPVDGIVILFNAFGTVGNLKSYTNMNRTITHEVGHYLGLYHTFHTTTSCTGETSCTTQGDRVCDTPATTQGVSCSSPVCPSSQVENYMDYTSQTCQDMFTDGQKLRMRTTLETQRTSIISSLGCMPVFQYDIGITAIIKPIGTNCPGALSPQVTLANFGGVSLTNATIQYNVDGVGISTYNWTGSLAVGASTTVTLPSINPAAGSHIFYAWTNTPNGNTDENSSNDQSTGAFSIANGSPAQLVVVLDFYGAETTWNITDASSNVLINGGPYVNNQQGLQITTPVCLSPGCYTLTMNDSFGDGQSFTSGSFTLTSGSGAVLASGSGNWGSVSTNNFCVSDSNPQGQAPTASFTIQDNTICRNVQNDYTSTSTGSPTSYSWVFEGGTPATSTQQNPQNVTYANAGTYDVTLTVSNANGSNTYVCANCVTIFANPTVTLATTNPGCGTTPNGSITSTVSGTGPFTYSWNTGSTAANLTNVGAGTYTVTVTSSQGCTAQSSATLNTPSGMTISGTAQNITCAGLSNGSINITVSGGTGNKTYSWSNGATTANISNLSSGSYTVTVTDGANCTATATYTILAPSALSVSGSAVATSCATSTNGSISAVATGGTGSKTYLWSNGATTASVSNLAAGTYSVTVTDAAGCTATGSYTVTSPTAITISGTATAATCSSASNGSIALTVSGGTGNKTYAWNTGATTANLNNLAPGNYTVTVTDAAGCTASASFTITAPAGITVSGTATATSCAGGANGSISVTATGGTGNKTYLWSNGSTTTTISNLTPGSYSVTVTDAAGCTATASYTVTAPAAIVISGTATASGCSSTNNGSISITVTGGTGNKTYAWSNGETTATINNLAPGTYTVTATDAAGCTATATYTITASTALAVTGTVENATCATSNNGSIALTVTGGTGNKTYLWNNNATSSSINNLAPGSYSVTVTDAAGCTANASFTVTAPAEIVISGGAIGATCASNNNGSISITSLGGTGNSSYAWSNGATSANISNLAPGSYNVTATDAAGCTATASYTVTAPTAIIINGTTVAPSCAGSSDASISVTASGGTGNKTYSWSNGATGNSISNLASGNYTVTVTDANGCSEIAVYAITAPAAITISGTVAAVSCFGESDGSIQVTASGGTGNKLFSWSNGTIGATASNLSPGTYTVTATDANNCNATQTFTITSPTALTLSGNVTAIDCFGGNDGAVAVSAGGGSGAISISWSNGAQGTQLSNLVAGEYTATATDALGCSIEENFVVNQSSAIQTNLADFDIACNDASGSALVAPSGGNAPYTILWSNGITLTNNESLSIGNYSVTVTDANGCNASTSFEITQSDNLSVYLQAQEISCFGASDGSLTVLVNGGDQNYTYEWDNGSSTAAINNLSSGQYNITVTDGTGCQGSATANLTQPLLLSVFIDATNIACNGASTGSASALVEGGTGPFEYLWSTGNQEPLIEGLAAGIISIEVLDNNGCAAQAEVNIEQPSALLLTTNATADESCAGNDGSAEVVINGGSPTYTILWSNGSDQEQLQNVSAGVYLVSVTDANGCSANSSVEITNNCVTEVPPTQLTSTFCNAIDLPLDAMLECEAIDGADQYMWRISSTTNVVLIEEYTSDVFFSMSSIPGIDYNTTYLVAVMARVNETWGPFGEDCPVTTIASNLPTAAILEEDCGVTIQTWGETIEALTIDGALSYQWHIVGTNFDFTTTTTSSILIIDETLGLTEFETYEITVRCDMGQPGYTAWSEPCNFTLGDVSVFENTMGAFNFSVYPNPTNGQSFSIHIDGALSTYKTLTVELMDATGKLLISHALPLGTNNYLFEPESGLSQGLYMVSIRADRLHVQRKLLVF